MKRVTLLTCNELEGKFHDDHLLINALKENGLEVDSRPWENFEDKGEDLFIIRTTWNYTDHYDQFIQVLEKIKDRLLNPLALVKWNADKRYLIELYNKGLNVLPLELAHDHDSLTKAMNKLGGEEFIIKPIYGASAKGLIKFNKLNPPSILNEVIVQKYYPQITKGEISLIYYNKEFAYAVKKIPKNGDIRVQEEHGGILESYFPTELELKDAQNIVNEIKEDCLYARVDLIPDLGLIELECIEPGLFFKTNTNSTTLFINALKSRLDL